MELLFIRYHGNPIVEAKVTYNRFGIKEEKQICHNICFTCDKIYYYCYCSIEIGNTKTAAV